MSLGSLAPVAAYAVEPSVSGGQTGTGVTDVSIQYKAADIKDIGGTEDPNNPDVDPADGLGDNVAFTVPTSINFVADSSGKMTGPSKDKAYIENESAFSIHASAFKTGTANNWTIVRDEQPTSVPNAVDFQFGPEDDKAGNVDAIDYQNQKTSIASVASDAPYVEDWNMAPKANSGIDDRVQLNTSGDLHNVTQDITEKTKVSKFHTYITAGNAVGDGSGGGQTTPDTNSYSMTVATLNNSTRSFDKGTSPSDANDDISASLGFTDGTVNGSGGTVYDITGWTYRAKGSSEAASGSYTTWSALYAAALPSSDATQAGIGEQFANAFDLVAVLEEREQTQDATAMHIGYADEEGVGGWKKSIEVNSGSGAYNQQFANNVSLNTFFGERNNYYYAIWDGVRYDGLETFGDMYKARGNYNAYDAFRSAKEGKLNFYKGVYPVTVTFEFPRDGYDLNDMASVSYTAYDESQLRGVIGAGIDDGLGTGKTMDQYVNSTNSLSSSNLMWHCFLDGDRIGGNYMNWSDFFDTYTNEQVTRKTIFSPRFNNITWRVYHS
jgi:hypothetical protein